MSPTSYRGPLQVDEEQKRTFSQTEEANLGLNQPGRTVAAILAQKGQEVFTVSPETTVLQAIGELNRLQVGVLLVIEGGRLMGILSERDIVRNIEIKGLELFDRPVSEVMTAEPLTCSPEDSLEKVIKEMTRSQFRHMPVMKDEELCGVVSIRDIMHHRLGELEYENLKIKQAIVG